MTAPVNISWESAPTGFNSLDFRTKLVVMGAILLATLLWDNVWLCAALAIGVFGLILIAELDRQFVRRLIVISLPFYGFIILMQAWFGGPLVSQRLGLDPASLSYWFKLPPAWPVVGGWGISFEGILFGISIVCKTFALSLLLPLVVLSTDANAVVSSLSKLGIPHKLAFVFSATLRFFPLLLDESRAIIEAQQLRGVDVASLRPLRKLATYARIAVPLILGAYTRSQYLEMVLQAKAFPGSDQRTYLYNAQLRREDGWVMLVSAVFMIAIILAYGLWGFGRFNGII